MKNFSKFCIYSLITIGVFFLVISCSKKTDDNNPSPAPNTVTDIDGNVYHTLAIGTQVWMVENLKTTRLNDGISIPLITDNTAWSKLSTPGYCWYNNDAAAYKKIYGALYNWHVVNTEKLAPTGWHVPTDAEWAILSAYLGGDLIAGGKMKSAGTIEAGTGLWYSPNSGATNESWFTAFPSGTRVGSGPFDLMGRYGFWWSSSDYLTSKAWYWSLVFNYNSFGRGLSYELDGFSVRCLKN